MIPIEPFACHLGKFRMTLRTVRSTIKRLLTSWQLTAHAAASTRAMQSVARMHMFRADRTFLAAHETNTVNSVALGRWIKRSNRLNRARRLHFLPSRRILSHNTSTVPASSLFIRNSGLGWLRWKFGLTCMLIYSREQTALRMDTAQLWLKIMQQQFYRFAEDDPSVSIARWRSTDDSSSNFCNRFW